MQYKVFLIYCFVLIIFYYTDYQLIFFRKLFIAFSHINEDFLKRLE